MYSTFERPYANAKQQGSKAVVIRRCLYSVLNLQYTCTVTTSGYGTQIHIVEVQDKNGLCPQRLQFMYKKKHSQTGSKREQLTAL